MPPLLREASIYTGFTIAEYIRDMGYNVTVSVDSITHWGEAAYENAQYIYEDTDFVHKVIFNLERAGIVVCLGNPMRKGSITPLISISAPGESVSCQCSLNWSLDDRLAKLKHFPSINRAKCRNSALKYLDKYFNDIDCEYIEFKETLLKILHSGEELTEIVQLVGKDELPERDKVILECAALIREDFWQQNTFTSYDYYCPLYKTIGMLGVMIHFYKLALKAVEDNKKVTWKLIESTMNDLINKISCMKYESPNISLREQTLTNYSILRTEITKRFNHILL